MGRTKLDDAGTATSARPRIARTAAVIALVACMGSLPGCSSSSDDGTPPAKSDTDAPAPAVTLADDAPTYCAPLISTQVRRLTRALPSIPVAGRQSSTADTVTSGAVALRSAASDMPPALAAASRRVAATATAYLAQPRSRDRLNDAVHALQGLAKQSHQECGL